MNNGAFSVIPLASRLITFFSLILCCGLCVKMLVFPLSFTHLFSIGHRYVEWFRYSGECTG